MSAQLQRQKNGDKIYNILKLQKGFKNKTILYVIFRNSWGLASQTQFKICDKNYIDMLAKKNIR